jgi:chitinase
MAKDPVKRNKFVNSAVALLKEHDFDGLDINWEYPSNRDGDRRVDKANFIPLLTELKKSLRTARIFAVISRRSRKENNRFSL